VLTVCNSIRHLSDRRAARTHRGPGGLRGLAPARTPASSSAGRSAVTSGTHRSRTSSRTTGPWSFNGSPVTSWDRCCG